MNKRKMMMLALAVCMIAILAVGGTLAYFTAEETAYNVITFGELTMELKETTTDGEPWPEEGVHQLVPGAQVDKRVTMRNLGTVDFYVRAKIDAVVTGQDGRLLPLDEVELNLNTEEWTEKDGCYYYKKALASGEETEPLFTMVSFSTEMGNEYMNARLEIQVDAQAVQSRNNGEDALSATGWPVFEEDGE